jgi:hypothetical protein
VIYPGIKFVTLDDDISINQVWNSRLEKFSNLSSKIDHISFTSGNEFRNWVMKLGSHEIDVNPFKVIYLVDYELINQNVTGLDLIEELGIAKQAVLVTSRYEETHLIERCNKIGTKLIPKTMAGFVPLEIMKEKEFFDCVLIDDDQLVHSTWKFAAENKGKAFAGFYNPNDFFKSCEQLDLNSKIYFYS